MRGSLLKASPEKTVEISFPSKHLGCTHSREQWAQRTVHCAASLRDAAKKGYSRLETTGRGLGMRWKHPSAARVANDPQGREWVPSRQECRAKVFPVRTCVQWQGAVGSLAQHSDQCQAAARHCSQGPRSLRPARRGNRSAHWHSLPPQPLRSAHAVKADE